MKTCYSCKITKPLCEFSNKKNRRDGKSSYCKQCFSMKCIARWIQRKKDAIAYKNGACHDCGTVGLHYSVYEFHHRDPNIKDSDWTKLRLKKWSSILTELDKCDMLCANCHRIRHAIIQQSRHAISG